MAERGLPSKVYRGIHFLPSKVYRGIHTWDSNRVTHMDTSLTPDFKNELAERPGAGRSAMSGHQSAGGLDRVCPARELSGEFSR